MAITQAQKNSVYRYKAKNIKRIPLDVQKDYYNNVLHPAADAAGLPVNGYIKEAIAEKIERDRDGPGSPGSPGQGP